MIGFTTHSNEKHEWINKELADIKMDEFPLQTVILI